MTPQANTLLAIRNLTVEFRVNGESPLRAVNRISLDVPTNSTVALVGESGSGKSVTALAIMGLLPRENATVGAGSSISYKERELLTMSRHELRALRGRSISMIFQEPMSSLNPVFTVGFQLVEVLRQHLNLSRRAARTRAIELLADVGIPDPATKFDAYPFQLSGGQQQRVMIAMAIACEPELLIADEPTTALDVTVQKQIVDLLAEIQKRRAMSVLFITHDLALVAEIADHVIVMREGIIREQGEMREVFDHPHDAYTKALLACRPRLSRRPYKLPVIDDFLDAPAIADPTTEPPQRKRGLHGDESVILEARHLTKTFYRRAGLLRKLAEHAVQDATFTLAQGKTLGIVGESGSGKTTLALMLMRLLSASNGQVFFEGRDLLHADAGSVLELKRRIQIVFQNPYASLNPRFTVGQILTEPMQIHGIGADANERRALALQMLDKVGLPAASFFKYPHEFSGGQRQRIAIARCLTLKPDVLICDEAVSALDVSIQAQLLNLLQDLQDEYRMSYLFISHDLAVVKYMSDEIMVMKAGMIVEKADSDEIYARPRHPYTRQLLNSMPRTLETVKASAG
ncbi:MAG: dipeptide ABC transporter ATP-binding protein [Pseudomonadota bacterium]